MNALRIPVIGQPLDRGHERRGPLLGRDSRARSAPPWVSLVAATAVLLAAAAARPRDLNIGANSITTLPDRFSSKQGFVALQRDFPAATTDPVRIIVPEGESQARVPQVLSRSPTASSPPTRASVLVDPRLRRRRRSRCSRRRCSGDPAGERAVAAVRDLRDSVVPAAFAGTDATALVGGTSSESVDYFDATSDPAPIRLPLRARADLRPAHGRVPLDRRRAHERRAQSPLGRRRVRAARARVPARGGRRSARLPAGRRHRGVGATLPLLRALRALDGLPGVPAQPDPRALHRRRRHARGRVVGRLLDGTADHGSGADHRRGLPRLRAWATW